MQRANLPNPLRTDGGADSVPSGFSLTLVGFSKGCVVLNQMVYELAGARADPDLSHFVKSVSDMFWLDGGHPGGSETWVTDKQVGQRLFTLLNILIITQSCRRSAFLILHILKHFFYLWY